MSSRPEAERTARVVWARPRAVVDWLTATGGVELAGDERARASRFLRDADREEYVAAHALLRKMLGEVSGAGPGTLTFGRGRRGRPFLSPWPAPGPRRLSFNLSHTRDLVVCGISRDRVGVDTERFDPCNVDADAVAAEALSPPELAALAPLQGAERRRRIVVYWSLKEAFAKALGLGLALPFRRFAFDIDAESTLAQARDLSRRRPVSRWRFRIFFPTSCHVVAVAVRSSETHLQAGAFALLDAR